MHHVYILKSKTASKTYVGITNDLERRLKEHNDGQHTYTKRFTPWKIVYTEESVDRKAAREREKYFKSAAGRRFMKREIF